ncbi:uncharacterized protein G2W53_031745 [Senna tora]|uniref:Uncharacterized protein n=1 Tax=Senna tora TaxID=362788 RepID=A0A834WB58_9FABA|nr:uncharacterized protein G2W53_031745 [Senna tora]
MADGKVTISSCASLSGFLEDDLEPPLN